MADVLLGAKEGYDSGNSAKPINVLNSTDTVELIFVNDYSALGLRVTTSAGVETIYEVAITERV